MRALSIPSLSTSWLPRYNSSRQPLTHRAKVHAGLVEVLSAAGDIVQVQQTLTADHQPTDGGGCGAEAHVRSLLRILMLSVQTPSTTPPHPSRPLHPSPIHHCLPHVFPLHDVTICYPLCAISFMPPYLRIRECPHWTVAHTWGHKMCDVSIGRSRGHTPQTFLDLPLCVPGCVLSKTQTYILTE